MSLEWAASIMQAVAERWLRESRPGADEVRARARRLEREQLVERIRDLEQRLRLGTWHDCGGPSRDPEATFTCDCLEWLEGELKTARERLRALRNTVREARGGSLSASGGATGLNVRQMGAEPSGSAGDASLTAIGADHRTYTEARRA